MLYTETIAICFKNHMEYIHQQGPVYRTFPFTRRAMPSERLISFIKIALEQSLQFIIYYFH
jgi:hypothetical protein